MTPFFTIGHSTRSIAEFVALLREARVTLLADVRTIPRSRYNPQFNTEALAVSLAGHAISYHHIARLGGRRAARKDLPVSPNGFWESGGLRNYADYATTAEFRAGLAELCALREVHVCAIMCAEASWRNCHRQIITDYLLAEKQDVRHIMEPGHIEAAILNSHARVQVDGTLIYPSETPSFL